MTKYKIWLWYSHFCHTFHIGGCDLKPLKLCSIQKKLPAGTGYVIFCHSPYPPDSMNHQKTFHFEIIFSWNIFVTTLMCQVFY